MQKLQVILDGNNFSTLEGFYNEVDQKLTRNLDWETGHNFDAFDDILQGGFGVHEYDEPIEIVWNNSTKSRNDLDFDETIKFIENKLEHCHPTNIKDIEADLELAKQHKGKTLFKIIVDIIKSHDHIDLKLS